jgi:hypothetical protein
MTVDPLFSVVEITLLACSGNALGLKAQAAFAGRPVQYIPTVAVKPDKERTCIANVPGWPSATVTVAVDGESDRFIEPMKVTSDPDDER